MSDLRESHAVIEQLIYEMEARANQNIKIAAFAARSEVRYQQLGTADGLREAVALLKPLLADVLGSQMPVQEEAEMRVRRYLWLSHGHRGVYGDDGEMQCGECIPFGAVDYKREPLSNLIKAVEDVCHARMVDQLSTTSVDVAPVSTRMPGARKVTEAELAPFKKAMEEEVIPAIVEAVHQRAVSAAESRNKVIFRGPPETIVDLRVALETEQTLKAAWEKRAYEAEAELVKRTASAEVVSPPLVLMPAEWADAANLARGLCESEANRWDSAAPSTAAHWRSVATRLGALYLAQDSTGLAEVVSQPDRPHLECQHFVRTNYRTGTLEKPVEQFRCDSCGYDTASAEVVSQPCRVCGGSGFVAQKQFIDDGYGEVDSCPKCDGAGTHAAQLPASGEGSIPSPLKSEKE